MFKTKAILNSPNSLTFYLPYEIVPCTLTFGSLELHLSESSEWSYCYSEGTISSISFPSEAVHNVLVSWRELAEGIEVAERLHLDRQEDP